MVVDDSEQVLGVTGDLLAGEGYVVRTVGNAAEAAEAVASAVPDLMILDVSMPGEDGLSYCERLRTNHETAELPVIFLTALTDDATRRRAFELGAVDFIEKPFDNGEFLTRVRNQARFASMRREMEEYNGRLHKMMTGQIGKIMDDQRYLIYGLVKLAESREDPTGTHMENVGYNSRFLAQSLQLSPKFEKEITNNFIEDIELAAPLHDIGNLTIGDRILLKNGKLTADEMAVMKTHAETGAKALMEVFERNEFSRYLGMAIDIAWYHHERWDGKGYPKGLRGKEIPISARIVSIADVYDTLTRDKCYRDAFTHDEAVEMVRKEAGRSFDPDMVEIFLKIQGGLKKN